MQQRQSRPRNKVQAPSSASLESRPINDGSFVQDEGIKTAPLGNAGLSEWTSEHGGRAARGRQGPQEDKQVHAKLAKPKKAGSGAPIDRTEVTTAQSTSQTTGDNRHSPRPSSATVQGASPEVGAGSDAKGSSTLYPKKKPATNRNPNHSRRKEPGHIKRPANSFFLFRSHAIKTGLLSQVETPDHRNVSRIVGHLWNSLSEADRKSWDLEYQRQLAEHQRMFPDYRYKPEVRKGDKIKRKIRREEGEVEKCEELADQILRAYSDTGLVRDETGGTMSESKRRKVERHERYEAQKAQKQAEREAKQGKAVGRVAHSRRAVTHNRSSVSTASSVVSASPAPSLSSEWSLSDGSIFEARRESLAGDLATSLTSEFTNLAPFNPEEIGGAPEVDMRRELDDHQTAQHLRRRPSADFQDLPPHNHHMQREGATPLDASDGNAELREAVELAFPGRWRARHTPPPPMYTNGLNGWRDTESSALHTPSVLMGSFSSQSTPSKVRKAPPPPMTFLPQYAPFRTSTAMSPRFFYEQAINDNRPRSAEGDTPRSSHFALHHAHATALRSHDVSLVSPLNSHGGGQPRRPGTGRHAWNRWSQLGSASLTGHSGLAASSDGRRGSTQYSGVPFSPIVGVGEGRPLGSATTAMTPTTAYRDLMASSGMMADGRAGIVTPATAYHAGEGSSETSMMRLDSSISDMDINDGEALQFDASFLGAPHGDHELSTAVTAAQAHEQMTAGLASSVGSSLGLPSSGAETAAHSETSSLASPVSSCWNPSPGDVLTGSFMCSDVLDDGSHRDFSSLPSALLCGKDVPEAPAPDLEQQLLRQPTFEASIAEEEESQPTPTARTFSGRSHRPQPLIIPSEDLSSWTNDQRASVQSPSMPPTARRLRQHHQHRQQVRQAGYESSSSPTAFTRFHSRPATPVTARAKPSTSSPTRHRADRSSSSRKGSIASPSRLQSSRSTSSPKTSSDHAGIVQQSIQLTAGPKAVPESPGRIR
ncbi:unnamed protein product [Jaminaea pallidilutea]